MLWWGRRSKKLGKSGDGIQSELGKLGSAWSAPAQLGMHSLVYRRAHICAISEKTLAIYAEQTGTLLEYVGMSISF